MGLEISQLVEDIKESPNGLAINKTRAYIVPSLSLYKNVDVMGGLHLVAAGVWDDQYGDRRENHLFLLFKRTPEFVARLRKIRLLDWYEDDYIADNILEKRLHVIVVRLPLKGLTKKLLEGRYSEMYEKDTAFNIFIKRYSRTNNDLKLLYANSYMTCTKSEDRRLLFQKEVNQHIEGIGITKGHEPYHEDTAIKIAANSEYDFVPEPHHEIFNYGYDQKPYGSFIERIRAI